MLGVFYLVILTNLYPFSNEFVFTFFLITCGFYFSERIVLKLFLSFLRSRGMNYKTYIIIGAGQLAQKLYHLLETSNEFGINVIGLLDDAHEEYKKDPEYPEEFKKLLLGDTECLEAMLKTNSIDNVIIALPTLVEDVVVRIANICEKYGVRAELLPDYYKLTSRSPSVRMIREYPLIGIRNVPLENLFNRLLKRLLDLVIAIVGLIVLSPFFLVIMLTLNLVLVDQYLP